MREGRGDKLTPMGTASQWPRRNTRVNLGEQSRRFCTQTLMVRAGESEPGSWTKFGRLYLRIFRLSKMAVNREVGRWCQLTHWERTLNRLNELRSSC